MVPLKPWGLEEKQFKTFPRGKMEWVTQASLLGNQIQLSLILIPVWQSPTETLLELYACEGK